MKAWNYVKWRLVTSPHDETTSQANDGHDKGWVQNNEFLLQKKGQGQGLHKSGTICGTVGYLKEGRQTLEYGKNYDGYWTGELFIKQACASFSLNHSRISYQTNYLISKLIPAFEEAHGPGYQALFLIDNSQGHSAYSENALLVCQMNVHPGGKQAHMRDGWFVQDGQKIIQPMIYLRNDSQNPNAAKGIKAVLIEHGLY